MPIISAARDDLVGRTPWSAADALVGLQSRRTRRSGADEGVRSTTRLWLRLGGFVGQARGLRRALSPPRLERFGTLLALTVAAVASLAGQAPQPRAQEHLEVPPPPFSEGLFPCSSCHADLKVNPTRRALSDMHGDIVLKHDEEHRWCLDCHDPGNRDWLRLASGERVPFEESYRLCGQCHGEKLRDWRAGVHGRRTGNWNGAKRYLLCAHCHNPHQPRFPALQPAPAPVRPARDWQRKQGAADGQPK